MLTPSQNCLMWAMGFGLATSTGVLGHAGNIASHSAVLFLVFTAMFAITYIIEQVFCTHK